MPRQVQSGSRVELRIKPDEKAMLARAAAIRNMDLTGFILQTMLPEAQSVIQNAEKVVLSERDSAKVLELLVNPPKPGRRLKRAARQAAEKDKA